MTSALARMRQRVSAAGTWLLVLGPGALVVAFGFSAGGYFPGAVAAGVIVLGLALVLRVTLAERPLSGLSPPYVAAAVALGLFALWTFVSSNWSHAPARALVEYDRALLYLLAFVLFGALGRTTQRLRWMIRAIAFAAAGICLCGFITRALPDVWSVAPDVNDDRLGYPLTYWNALGLMAALGLVLCFALTSDARESRVGRVLAAAALPLLGATLLLTFSRGAVVAGGAGLVAVVVIGRPGAVLSGLLVGVPSVAVAIRAAYDADLLATLNPTTVAATAQGHDLAHVVALCALAAAAGRAFLLALDAALGRIEFPERLHGRRRELRWAANALPALAVLVAALALGVPREIQQRYDAFVGSSEISEQGGVRGRLLQAGNNGRIAHWEVAKLAFRENRLHGDGAGTYALRWDKDRPQTFQVEDGHSLLFEVLGELGLVGFGLLAITLALILGGFLARARGPDRMVGAALFAAGLTWLLHAGVDWQWEMPAVTLWVFAAGGLALAGTVRDAPAACADAEPAARPPATAPAAPAAEPAGRPPLRNVARIAVALGLLGLLVVPLSIYRSQGPLRESARAFARGDCPTAVDRALASSEALGARPEPYVLLGYCDVRLGQSRLGVRAMERAVRLDPDNWETHYGLALVRGAAGLDPRPAARAAARLNPSDSDLATEAVTLFAGAKDPRTWRRRALGAPLPFE